MPKVWLVTGSGRGLGRDIAEAVLAGGDKLVAGVRDINQLDALVRKYGDSIRPVTLDVTSSADARSAVKAAIDSFGKLDVVVNNAGFGHVVPFEQMTDEDFRSQIDTNFYGVVNLTRAAATIMREQKSGHIIQISSVGGRIGTPGLSAYQSAKWAVGGFTEVLAQELAPFGVVLTTLEPGGMKTNWGFIAKDATKDLHPAYRSTIGVMLDFMEKYVGNENSDPKKVAEVVFKIGYHPQPPAHVLIGSDAYMYATRGDANRASDAERWRGVSEYTDFESTSGLPELPAGVKHLSNLEARIAVAAE